jgi:PHD/YefM family antitoxin component YafN of YafNO toxin-antitoxin module
MSLKEILEDIAVNQEPILLCAGGKEYEASSLLETLHPVKLKRKAHMQSGMYIAAINDAGYLGDVMYKIKQK